MFHSNGSWRWKRGLRGWRLSAAGVRWALRRVRSVMRFKRAASAVAVASAVLLVGWAAPAQANPVGTFKWTNAKSGRCTDADLNTIGGNGTRVQLWDCNGQSQ